MDAKEQGLRWLQENLMYIDSVTIVDNSGRIIAKQRFNPRYAREENRTHSKLALGKNLLEVFPSLSPEESTLLQVLSTGKIVYLENQAVWNDQGKKTVCNNLNFPLIYRGKIVGAVELSRDITNMDAQVSPAAVQLSPPPPRNTTARYTLDDIIADTPQMLQLKQTILKVANSHSSVMICGETGTGKELFASALHNASYRKGKAFVAVNCAALPENILEGLLFGSCKGAFTGAENRKGLIQEADGGTLYLDEINSMPLNLQAKILRVLQEKQVMPLGSATPISVDVRVISSSNRSLEELLNCGELRADLLYRLNTVTLTIPPLKKRTQDIPLLVNYFLHKHSQMLGRNCPKLTDDALQFLMGCRWHGNVRELEHTIEAALNILGEQENAISLEQLPAYLTIQDPPEVFEEPLVPEVSLTEAMAQYEKKLLTQAMAVSHGRIVDAAKRLKIPRTTLQYKLEKYCLIGK